MNFSSETYFVKLNYILDIIHKNYSINFESIDIEVKENNTNIRLGEIQKILDFLKEEKYIDVITGPRAGSANSIGIYIGTMFFYSTTIKGDLFISIGGYVQQEADRLSLLAEQAALKTLEMRLKEKAVEQNRQLIRVGGFAAAFAGAVILFDILKLCIEQKAVPMSVHDICFYFLGVPAFFLLMYYLIRKLP